MHELLTTDEMARADRLAIAAGVCGLELMERAGAAVAWAVRERLPRGASVAVVCGGGNNGGDGFVAARLLTAWGYRVGVLLLGTREALRGDAAAMAARWSGTTGPATPDALAGADLILDAIVGAGLSRPVEGAGRAMIEAINASGLPVVAVDLPSGISGTTGAVMGAAVKATETVTFFRKKPGHLLLPGRLHCGLLRLTDIGLPTGVLDEIRPRTFVNAPALWAKAYRVPSIEGHKYTRGHAVVVSGTLSYTGAARLVARAALRAGAGLVTIASPPDALLVHAVTNLAVMVRSVEDVDALAGLLKDQRLNAVVLGPGGGIGAVMRAQVAAALCGGGRGVVLDADALTSFAGEPRALSALLKGAEARAVLTPHEGEFARLFGPLREIAEASSKLQRARAAARFCGCAVLLKGPDTVVAAPDGRAAVGDNAPPWLGTAGSGDVLAGIVAAHLAQGMPAFEAACAAAWLHGEAGEEAGPGLISEDLPEALRPVLRRVIRSAPASNDVVAEKSRALGLPDRADMDHALARHLGREGDADRLSGLKRERVEPERLPAVVELVEQAEGLVVQLENLRRRRAVRQRENDRAAALGGEGRCERSQRRRVRRRRQLRACGAADRNRHAQGLREVHALGQRIGGERFGRRQRLGAWRGLRAVNEAGDRHGPSRALERERGRAARRRAGVDEKVDPVSRRERDAALARGEGLGWLPVDRHHEGAMVFQAQREEPRRGSVDEPQAQPLPGANRDVEKGALVGGDVIGRPGLGGVGGHEGAVGLEPPVLEQQGDVGIDAHRRALVDDQHA